MSIAYRFLLQKSKLQIVLGVLSVFTLGVFTASTVSAIIPDASGTIHACYTTGLVPTFRIVDATTCSGPGETHLTWKQGGSATGVLRPDIAGKDLSGAQMVYWDLRGMNLAGTNFNSANLSGADLRTSTLTNTDLSGANLTDTDLSSLTLTGASLSSAQLNRTILTSTSFSNANLAYTNFYSQNISGRNLASATSVEGIMMNGGNMSGVSLPPSPNLKWANLGNSNLNNINFTGANLAGAFLIGSTFTGSTVTGVTWVEGSNSAMCPDATRASDNGNTCVGHLTP